MDKKTEALKLAEDVLKRVRTQDMELVQLSMIALAAIREALVEQPAQQEPVAWMRHDGTRCCPDEYRKDYPDYETRYPTPLYAHPAAQGSPVAWMVYAKDGLSVYVTDNPTGISEGQRALPLYTSPQAQRTWVGLTDDEILYCVELENPKAIAEEVEAKLREKNQ